MRTAIVSGVTGHLGCELARQLAAAGVMVHGLSRSNASAQLSTGEILVHHIDGTTAELLNIFEKVRPDAVFHLAGLARRAHNAVDVSPFVDANILFGTQLLEAARQCGCHNFITAGTYLQHFRGSRGGSMNLYAATKNAFETLIQYYVDAFGLTATRLTLCDIYSEVDKRRKLMTDIADACAGNVPLTLLHENAYLDLVHVEDAAHSFIHTATLMENAEIAPGRLTRHSVSSGRDVNTRELIEMFERISNRKLTVQYQDAPVLIRDMRPWRGKLLQGWAPRIPLEEGIERMLKARNYVPIIAPASQH